MNTAKNTQFQVGYNVRRPRILGIALVAFALSPLWLSAESTVSNVRADQKDLTGQGILPRSRTIEWDAKAQGSEALDPAAKVRIVAIDPGTGPVMGPMDSISDWQFVIGEAENNADNEFSDAVAAFVSVGRLVNFSTRGRTEGGGNTMIAGFVLEGGNDLQLLLRVIGPTLGSFGVAGTATDPRIRLFRSLPQGGSEEVDVNDDWQSEIADDKAASAIRTGAFGLEDGSKDAVLLANLPSGSYTAHAELSDGAPGVVLIEVYDDGGDCRVANISTRGVIGQGSSIMIAGTVIEGASLRLLVRAIGPTLGSFGVGGSLSDTMIEIVKDNQVVADNDDWGLAANADEIVSTSSTVGAFALENGSRDSVILTTLEPGAYTVKVMGKGGETGVALVELYELPTSTHGGPSPEDFSLVPAGTYTMGSPSNELGRDFAETQHSVTLTKSFHLAKTEMTWARWNEVRDQAATNGYTDIGTGRNGCNGDASGEHPVTEVSWWDVIKWCNLRSEIESKTPVYYTSAGFGAGNVLRAGTPTPYADWDADGYRLPTEAEWEYACRAGSTTTFFNGPITHTGSSPVDPALDKVGWYGGNSGRNTHPVGRKDPNAWKLYDMHGNVWEWCWDWYSTSYGVVPRFAYSGPTRVFKGGSWYSGAQFCRSAMRRRGCILPGYRDFSTGFRPALTAVP